MNNPLRDTSKDLLAYERQLEEEGRSPVAGVDEAGRGALAGPVVAAAVILDPSKGCWGRVRDSKTVPEQERERLFELISSQADCWAIGESSASEIDQTDILRATLAAMARAIEGLAAAPGAVLVDGNALPPVQCHCKAVVRGDALSLSVAAASLLAKVWRDRRMRDLDLRHPGYGFARHKGYGTAGHREALRRLGRTPEHRCTFRMVTPDGP